MKERSLDDIFRSHQVNEVQQFGMKAVRDGCSDLAITIVHRVPESEEKELALQKLQEVMMWANAGIAREGV